MWKLSCAPDWVSENKHPPSGTHSRNSCIGGESELHPGPTSKEIRARTDITTPVPGIATRRTHWRGKMLLSIFPRFWHHPCRLTSVVYSDEENTEVDDFKTGWPCHPEPQRVRARERDNDFGTVLCELESILTCVVEIPSTGSPDTQGSIVFGTDIEKINKKKIRNKETAVCRALRSLPCSRPLSAQLPSANASYSFVGTAFTRRISTANLKQVLRNCQ
jgi:hypothetical protein